MDVAGAPLEPSYVAYSRTGHRLNPVHPVTYTARGSPWRAATGRDTSSSPRRFSFIFRFRSRRIHRCGPRWCTCRSCTTHGASSTRDRLSRPGIFVIDATRRQATVSDLSGEPQHWEGSLRNLSSVINRLASRTPDRAPLRQTDPASAALTLELIGHFRQEYESFLARYRDVPRPRPEMPEHVRGSSKEEQQRWTEHIDADLAREPRWGMVITRLFSDELELFSEYEAALR